MRNQTLGVLAVAGIGLILCFACHVTRPEPPGDAVTPPDSRPQADSEPTAVQPADLVSAGVAAVQEIPADYPHWVIPVYQPAVVHSATRTDMGGGQVSFALVLFTRDERSRVVEFYQGRNPQSHNSVAQIMDTLMFLAEDRKTGGSVVIALVDEHSDWHAQGFRTAITITYGSL